jgi:hypothetical protein
MENTNGWTSNRGFTPYSFSSANQPTVVESINDNGIIGSNGYLIFSYQQSTVSQTVVVDTTSMDKLTATLSIVNIPNSIGTTPPSTVIDKFSFEVLFKDAGNSTLYSKRTSPSGTQNAPNVFTDYSLELNRSDSTNFDDIKSVIINITSVDRGGWNGQHGACVDYCTLNYE